HSKHNAPQTLDIYTTSLHDALPIYASIGALGFDEVKTPNMDRLVNSGATFTHAYNMGGWSGAICVASRAMIISGQHIWRAKEKEDRKSTRLNSSHVKISYAVFCLKK